MILTVTLNAALDITYAVERVRLGANHRVPDVGQRAGGKGINVARVLRALGADDVTVTGLAGGLTGTLVRDDVSAAGLEERLVAIGRESRRTVTVVDGDGSGATAFNEAGPEVDPSEWRDLLTTYAELAAGAEAIVLSGSLPPGLPDDPYGELIACARRVAPRGRAVPVVLDTDGVALLTGIAAGPDIVKPNREELHGATGIADPVTASRALRSRLVKSSPRGAVVASLGPEGLVALTSEGDWRASPPRAETGNPIGAGDAAVAALVLGAVRDLPWPERLRRAVALSGAAVRAPLAGDVAPDWQAVLPEVRVEAL